MALILPFWRAVLAYTDEPGHDGPTDPLVDPNREGPAVWFQQMDEPRPQRNRIHFDISVPHDEAEARVAAAIEAGGTLVSDPRARAFWVLADAEGNKVCVCTWQDRADRTSGLDGHLVDVVRRVSRTHVDLLDRLGARSLGQAEDHAGLRVGPGVLEVHLLVVLDGQVGLVSLVQRLGGDTLHVVCTSMNSGTVAPFLGLSTVLSPVPTCK